MDGKQKGMVVTGQTDREDQTFRSAQTVVRPILQNFQNKTKHSKSVIHTMGFHMCYNSYCYLKLYKTIYKKCRRFVVS